jgi:hypothetical protein
LATGDDECGGKVPVVAAGEERDERDGIHSWAVGAGAENMGGVQTVGRVGWHVDGRIRALTTGKGNSNDPPPSLRWARTVQLGGVVGYEQP